MKLQKLGGYASIILLCAIAIAIGIAALTLPRLGLPMFSTNETDPFKVMAALEASPITFRSLQPFSVLIPIAFVLIALALQERMQAKAPNLMRLAVIAASIASALFLANAIGSTSGMLSIAGNKDISAYRAFSAMQDGLSSAATNAWGWTLLLTGLAAFRTRALPRILGYIMLVCGIMLVIGFAIPSNPNPSVAGLVVVLAFVLLNIIGAIWLGVALIEKQEPSPA